MKKKTRLTILFLLAVSLLFAQEQKPKTKPGYFDLDVGLAYTKVKTKNLTSDGTLSVMSTFKPELRLGYSKQLNKSVFFCLGAQYRSFKTKYTCKGWFKNSTLSVDKDFYYYYPVSETDYKGELKAWLISVPLGFKIISGNPSRCRFLLQVALETDFIHGVKQTQTGKITTKGLYPVANESNVFILMQNDIQYGYFTRSVVDKDVRTREIIFGLSAAMGFIAPLNENVDLTFRLNEYTSLGNIISKDSRSSKYKNDAGAPYNYEKTSLKSAGVSLGLMIRV